MRRRRSRGTAAKLPAEVADIPVETAWLSGLGLVNRDLVQRFGERRPEQHIATEDEDATIIESRKGEAKPTYERERGYLPMLAVWAVTGLVLAHQFRDGNVPAQMEPLEIRQLMPRGTIDFDTVRDIVLTLPGVEGSTAYGDPVPKVHGKLLACVPADRSTQPTSLVVHVDFDDRAEPLDADPAVYYLTACYIGYSSVLVRFSPMDPDALRDVVGMAHKFVTSRAAPVRQCGRAGDGIARFLSRGACQAPLRGGFLRRMRIS